MTWTGARVLGDRDAGLYLAAVVVSGFGTSAMWLVSGIWVKDLTGSDGLAALCVFALWAPTLVGPALGTLADRTRRRPLLLATNLLLAALLPVLYAVDGRGGLWILFGVLLVYGAVGVVQDAAESALLATVLDGRLLGDFNGLRMTANEGMKLVAPLAGAGLYAAYGGPRVALLDAATFALAAGVYALLRVRETPTSGEAGPTGSLRARTAEGVRHLRSHPGLWPLVLAGGTTMLFAGINGATVYAVAEGLGHSPAYVGLLYVAQGAGSVAVGPASGTLLRRLGERRFAACGIALTAVAVTLRAVPVDAVALACSVGVGVGLPCVLVAAFTAVQRETPAELLGRASASLNTLLYAPNAVGLALGAGLVELVDLRVLLPVLGVARLVTLGPLLRGAPAAVRG
ncbi:MFS transporter [Streptomyces sp. NBC_01281]|uniref:MFS transporter n=1 Tax=unclassified Streptomyces TaxID=2593676 RepID=UPI002253C141|nr:MULTISPECIES: MFS transporter [unclassified Streptomyces]MCX5133931.1 MFS transporter [Streptomyces sp. NBC_00340]WSD80422.1 MFS transporter [Streptomyces sp. NBC_01558]WSK63993.1 MFS transporter [Streptomyces sp. NBC_01281]